MTTAQPEARLLVVEDEPNIRELLATSLRFAGFEVHVAADGATALHLATVHEPDLVVLDVMLPDMDGFTVTRKLRDTGRQLPIVFVTARDSVDDKIKGLTVGGDDYVTKPFSLEEVVARIRAVLRRTRGEVDDASSLKFEDLELDEDSHEVSRARARRSTSPPPSSSCCATSCSTPTGCCPRPRSSTTCGTTTSGARAESSSPTSPTCGARSTSTGCRH